MRPSRTLMFEIEVGLAGDLYSRAMLSQWVIFKKDASKRHAITEIVASKDASAKRIGMERLKWPQKIVDDFSTHQSFFS